MRPISKLLNYLIAHKFNMAIQDGCKKQLKMNNNNVLAIAKLINVVKIATLGFSTNLISIGYQY